MTNNNPTPEINGPLTGIKVLDWAIWQFGPVSTSMMEGWDLQNNLDINLGKHWSPNR